MKIEKNFKCEKMSKFTQFCNFERALEKICVFKNCSSGIRGWAFLTFSYDFGVFEAKELKVADRYWLVFMIKITFTRDIINVQRLKLQLLTIFAKISILDV